MKYSELFTLNPIESVIKIDQADQKAEAKRLVGSFVITPSLGEAIEDVAAPQLDFESGVEGKGIFVVGNYGTGKSHVMSFLSIISEDASMLQEMKNEEWKSEFEKFAGKYKVKRCQIVSTKMPLYEIVAEQLESLSNSCGFEFKFKTQRQVSNIKTEFARFMQEFDVVCPNMGVLLLIDEMLLFLQGRHDQDLVLDLGTLQALGEFCDGSRFVFMAGVQQSLFNNPRFNNVSSDINRIKQRYYDFVIDNKGVEQLIEQHLFEKNAAQKAQIKEILLKQTSLFEGVGLEIDQYVKLFPAHPRFIAEFQNVFVVERREILTILSREARLFMEKDWSDENPSLITSDRYWKHVETDQGLNTDPSVREVKKNVSTLKSRIQTEFSAMEDKPGAERLIEALAVNRLTTPNLNDAVGLTPQDLKNNLFWKTPLPMQDSRMLTAALKRLLDNVRKAANGQFLTVSDTTGQYYIDPTRVADYEQDVATAASTISKDAVQRYLNEIFTRAMELHNTDAVKEGRYWEYSLLWTDRNVERPGWLCFAWPNERSTAKPPKDFYLFVVPSKRVTGMSDSMPDATDETYWFMEDFPQAKCDIEYPLSENEPDSFLDRLRKYAAARERAIQCGNNLNEKIAFNNEAEKHLKILLPEFQDNAGDWISIQWHGQKKRFREWVSQLDPGKANAGFKARLDAISQTMFASFFEEKYADYPKFSIKIQEATRKHNAQSALEVICETGFRDNATGKAILTGLGLYKENDFVYDQSLWLNKIKSRLKSLGVGQYLNASEFYERKDEREWFKGESIEAEWLHVVLAAGARAGDLVLYGHQNRRYDATNLAEFMTEIKAHDGIVRIGKPSEIPYDLWRRIFKLFKCNTGLLANPSAHEKAVLEFGAKTAERHNDLIAHEQEMKTLLPFIDDETRGIVEKNADAFRGAKFGIETYLVPINSKAKLQNLKLDDAGIDALEEQLAMCEAMGEILHFVRDGKNSPGAIERFSKSLEKHSTAFHEHLKQLIANLNQAYRSPLEFKVAAPALKTEMQQTLQSAQAIYQVLHKRYVLDKTGDSQKKAVNNGLNLKQLNRLVRINHFDMSQLSKIREPLELMMTCSGCTDDELLKSPLSLCPRCSFNPFGFEAAQSALESLAWCEQEFEKLHKSWTLQLLNELDDPSVRSSIQVLRAEERKLIDEFVSQKALPAEISDSFINAINTALKGLKRKSVKTQDFATYLRGDGAPLKAQELRERFNAWLNDQLAGSNDDSVRFVLED